MSELQPLPFLVVDDEETIREILRFEFQKLGYDCRVAGSGEEALRIVEREPIQLAVLDIRLPDLDGLELFRRLRERDPDLAVVMMTGYGTMEDVTEALRLGASDFLSKPVDLNSLSLSVSSALEKRRLAMENRRLRENLEQVAEERTRRMEHENRSLASSLREMTKTFAGLLEKRDVSMGSHSKRVAAACRGVCTRLELRDTVRNDIETGALLHDIGKIGIPDSILRKTANFFEMSKLSEDEKRIVRMHPVIGQEAVEMIEMLNPVSLIIRHHHELFNGSGYPDQLAGYNIPLGSRIIAVVDAFDKVVYGVQPTKRDAARRVILTHLLKNSGILYDPDVVRTFLEYVEDLEKSVSGRRERAIPIADLKPGMTLSRDLVSTGGVLLAAQNEIVADSEYIRIMRLHQSKSVGDTVSIYDTSEAIAASARKNTPEVEGERARTEVDRESILRFRRVRDAMDKASGLSTLPTLYHNTISLLDDPSSTRQDIADLLKQDPAIVAKVLRLVNSPLFAFSRRITSIEDAIPLLGFSEIRSIVTSVSVLSMFAVKDGSDTFNRAAFWKHSAACAIACKTLARKLKVPAEEEYFTAGLLHDIGKLVLDQLFPEDFRKVIGMIGGESLFMRQAERTVFGRPHPSVGEYLLRKWKIPDILTDAVLHHHSPKDSVVDPFLVSAVCVSDMAVHLLRIGASGEVHVPAVDDFIRRQIGIGSPELDVLLPEIKEQIRQSEDLLRLGE